MNELEKVVRVIKKVDASAPHAVLLVLDATVGQNALSQVEAFHRTAGVTGLVMTKLDGTARGGILVALAEKFKLPVHFIGVGEGIEDLAPFTARDFANAIAGIESNMDKKTASAVQACDGAWSASHLFRRQRQVQPVRRHRRIHGGGAGCDDRVLRVTRHVPMMAIVTAVVVIVFGALTLILHDETFIKMKPTIVYTLFAAILGGGCCSTAPLSPSCSTRCSISPRTAGAS